MILASLLKITDAARCFSATQQKFVGSELERRVVA
jgi:hypothetical protein